MDLYNKILTNEDYLDTVKIIENTKFITDGKWDWEHGLRHYKRVAEYVKEILLQLDASEHLIDLGMSAALLHDVGLIKGEKSDHAIQSSQIFYNFIPNNAITEDEKEMLRQAILDHSKGNNIKSIIGAALLLADKLDVTYHRTINSSIQDEINKEIQKIKKVSVNLSDKYLIVNYEVEDNFNIEILKSWPKAITIPNKVAKYLNKEFIFKINDSKRDIKEFLT